ncbi:hypothetical protein FLM48_11095 [Shewanella sp. Scap07]|nr:hypothetical protein FLM48_11095 [Shewanella sp. Scap07]
MNRGLSTVEVIEDVLPLSFEPLNLTSPRAGIFISENDQAEKARLDADLKRREQLYFASANLSPAGRTESEKARLVKDRKSPTRDARVAENAAKSQALAAFYSHLHRKGVSVNSISSRDVVQPAALYADTVGRIKTPTFDKSTGEVLSVDDSQKTAVARLSCRDWSDEYRIRVTTNMSPIAPPPTQAGDRVTKFLTTRGAKNILDSGAYVAAVRGGYTTFLTLTFNTESRERIVSGESTIGAECSRFFDAIQKMYQRGWTADKTVISPKRNCGNLFSSDFECVANDEQMIKPIGDKLDYLWVAEAPTKNGVVNPHCHVLLRWQVEPHLFRAWAKRIESIWGHGFANLERIKNANAASGYMLKALGYLLKGEQSEQSDQGEIRGNRYNISKSARALPWEEIAAFHAEHMASIIGEVKAKLERKAAPTVQLIKQSYKQLNKAIRDKSFLQNNRRPVHKVDARIKAIENSIKHYKAQLRQSPVRAHDYLINFKGKEAVKTFINWAVGVRFWSANDAANPVSTSRLNPDLLTRAVNSARKTYSKVRNRYIESESLWVQRLAAVLPPVIDYEAKQAENLNDFLLYEKCLSI